MSPAMISFTIILTHILALMVAISFELMHVLFIFVCVHLTPCAIFGTTLLFVRLLQPHRFGETERKFPHSQLFLVGLFDALNRVLVVFISSRRHCSKSASVSRKFYDSLQNGFSVSQLLVILYKLVNLRNVISFNKIILNVQELQYFSISWIFYSP